jgi:aspartyl-tRNA(Asn)/glutamyl-tRNA(Gln) amidotransferase subunit C
MPIDRDEVRRIARLAQLEWPRVQGKDGEWREPDAHLLDEVALDALTRDLGKILDHVRSLEAVDVTGVEPTTSGMTLAPRTREDTPGPTLDTARALDQAPARVGDAFAVPRVLE